MLINLTFFVLVIAIVYLSYTYGRATAIANASRIQKASIDHTIMWLVRNNFLSYIIDSDGQVVITPIEDSENDDEKTHVSEEEI